MAEVFSTGVAMTFDAPGNKKKDRNEKNQKGSGKPKLSAEELNAKFKSKLENVLAQDGGQYIEFVDGTGLLVAGAMQKKRYYFVWLDRDRKLRFTDSKETFHLVKDIPISLSITDYLLRNEAQCLRDIVENFFKDEESVDADDKYTLIGSINLGPRADIDNKEVRKTKGNQKKKTHAKNNGGNKPTGENSEQKPKKKRNRNRNKNKSGEQKPAQKAQ